MLSFHVASELYINSGRFLLPGTSLDFTQEHRIILPIHSDSNLSKNGLFQRRGKTGTGGRTRAFRDGNILHWLISNGIYNLAQTNVCQLIPWYPQTTPSGDRAKHSEAGLWLLTKTTTSFSCAPEATTGDTYGITVLPGEPVLSHPALQ